MITATCMQQVRREQWEKSNDWGEGELDRILLGTEVLHEDLQDVSSPMVIIGTDVVNLYPSLDIKKVVGNVGEAILDSKITWQEIDFLEGARYIALNWSEEKCRSSGLKRVLPTRRYNMGSRPGLKGEGPQGGQRGDQEQWVFPQVRLRTDEKRMVLATVIQIATEAMFQHHYYGFAGKKVPAEGGGPYWVEGYMHYSQVSYASF